MYTFLITLAVAGLLYFALHVTNGGAFPKPLTPAEEREYVAAMRAGDRNARNRLIEHNLRLVAHVVKKYYGNARDADDLLSIGTIGLIKAVESFSAEKGTKLATYAARCIENEILMHFRSQKKTAQDVYFADPIETDGEGNSLTLLDIVCAEDTIADDIDAKLAAEKLHRAVAECLDERERTVVSFRYGLYGRRPLTQREVAAKLGISRSYISRIEKAALEKLRASPELKGGC